MPSIYQIIYDIKEGFYYFAFGSFGGIAYLSFASMRMKVQLSQIIASIFAAAFIGLTAAFLSHYFDVDFKVRLGIALMSGMFGNMLIIITATILLTKLGCNVKDILKDASDLQKVLDTHGYVVDREREIKGLMDRLYSEGRIDKCDYAGIMMGDSALLSSLYEAGKISKKEYLELFSSEFIKNSCDVCKG